MEEYYPSIEAPKVFTTPLGKTLLIICWDLLDHRLFESAVKQGVQWIIDIAFWSVNQSNDLSCERGKSPRKYRKYSDSQIIDALIKTRVTEYNLGVIFCNFGKTHAYAGRRGTDKAISAGRSQLLSPLHEIQKKIGHRKEQVLICDIADIKPLIRDNEIFYGRREDIKLGYPHY